MCYSCAAGSAENNGDDVKSIRAVVDFVGGQEIAGGPEGFGFFCGRDDGLRRLKRVIGSGFHFDEDDGAVAIGHNQVDFAGFAGEVSGECFEAFSF